ncbi:MAG: cob(I)yrinic acid a,c-diamide adenosyltransferase [Bdellovibrionales bacterium]|nr:cob(I)yrinic acid a,c-diamide adenosyltransferase [Bdellovibrionales bacterium]
MTTKIYTGRGDLGQTSLVSGKRVSKSHTRIAAYGTIDELNSSLGLVGAELQSLSNLANLAGFVRQGLDEIQNLQNQLFSVGSHLACDEESFSHRLPILGPGMSEHLERQIDEWTKQLPALTEFILPGGCKASAFLHLSRTICRRAERLVTQLIEEGGQVEPFILVFLNRMSDYLFVFARYTNLQMGFSDLTWKK